MNRRNRLRGLGLVLACWIAPIAQGFAIEAPITTQHFFAPGPSVPEDANAYLTAHPGNALAMFSIGLPAKPVDIFQALSPATRSRVGICRFTATQVFVHHADDGAILWDSTPLDPRDQAEPPYMMAARAENPCPLQNDVSYVALDDGITDEELIAVLNFWNEIAKSEAKFDEASVYLSLIVSPRAAGFLTLFRSGLFHPDGRKPQMQAVLRAGINAFDLAFGDPGTVRSKYFLSISKTGSTFQVVNFQAQ